jgi:DNA processing protein
LAGSALRWAALNLRLAGLPGARRQLLARDRADGHPADDFPARAADILGDGWEEAAGAEIERARRFGADLLTCEDAAYPALLRASSDPPPLLYVWGRLRPEDALAVAVVGSRRPTPHGATLARRLGSGLAVAGFTVTSGLARGIDAAGHRGALDAGGRTLAILGSGLDRIYPAEHRKLAEAIAGRGAVLSEFPFGTPPLKRHFPERNRVIAWISWATVVVEAARGSGSLITADLAADEGRLVFAVPGTVGEPNAEGTNALLRGGAIPCRGSEDVLEDLAPQLIEAARILAPQPSLPLGAGSGAMAGVGLTPAGAGPSGAAAGAAAAGMPALSADQRRVLARLPRTRGIAVDRLGQACGLAPGPLLAALLELEIRGLARALPGGRYMAAG